LIEVFTTLKKFFSKLKIHAEKELRERQYFLKANQNLDRYKNKLLKIKTICDKNKKGKNI
jgi:hypothetical protein